MTEASKTQSSTDKSGAVAKKPAKAKASKTVKITKDKEIKDGADQKIDKVTNDPDNQEKVVAETAEPKPAEEKLAKAGKHSAKAAKEAEAKQAKEERKKSVDKAEPTEAKAKPAAKPARSRLVSRGKNYRKSAELIEKDKHYTIAEAAELAKKTSSVKFDATVELHVRLEVDPRQADQNIRSNVVLPAGSGKTQRIAVFADGGAVTEAKKAGADIAGSDEFLQTLDSGKIDFDILIVTPTMMPKLGKYARLLGPKGLMPNPKSGTVTPNVAKAVAEAKAGRVEYRVDSTGIVHVPVGKVSFEADKLVQNIQAIVDSLKAAKPASIKGNYVKSVFVTTSMGPSIAVAAGELS